MDPEHDQHLSDLWTWAFRTLGTAVVVSFGVMILAGLALGSTFGPVVVAIPLGLIAFGCVLMRAEAPARLRARETTDLPG